MIYLFHGPEKYLAIERMTELIKEKEKEGFEIAAKVDLKEEKDFKIEEKNFFKDFFGKKKIFIFFNVSHNISFQKDLLEKLEYLKRSENDFIFIEEQPKGDLFNELKKFSQIFEFYQLNEKELKAWVKEKFRKFKKNISFQALEKLISFCENDLYRLENEILKLVSFCDKKENIDVNDVENIVSQNEKINIFHVLDLFVEGKRKEGFLKVKKLIENGVSPNLILSLFNWQMRNLFLAEGKKNFSHEIPIFLVKKFYVMRRRVNIEKLKKLYNFLFYLDMNIRKGKISSQVAIDLFLSKLDIKNN